MRKFRELVKRVEALKRARSGREAVIHSEDGGARVVRADVLDVVLACFEDKYSRLTGKPREPSRFDPLLRLLANATSVEGDNMWQLAFDTQKSHGGEYARPETGSTA